MSFFEDSDDAPRREPPRQSGAGGAGDRQTLMVRRTVAIGAGILVLVLLVLAVRGCLNARKERSYEDYVSDTTAVLQESDQQSKDLFETLQSKGGDQPVGVENELNTLSANSGRLVDRARKLDHPGELDAANGYLLQTLEFRRDGIKAIAAEAPRAGVRGNRTEAAKKIAAQMRQFDASDVIYVQRFVPDLREQLEAQDLENRLAIPKSQFLPNVDWLDPAVVLQRVSGIGSGGGDENAADGPVAPGSHGNGLESVTVQPGGATLETGTAADIRAGSNISFEVTVSNQGENDEKNVAVTVEVVDGGRPIKREDTIPTIAAGETKTVKIPLAASPPTGRGVKINVNVQPVPGEEDSENNKASYPAIFTRG